jgi:hypothetical protein
MNDQRQPTPYDAAIAEIRAQRDLLDQTLKTLESLRDGTPMASATATVTPSTSTDAISPPTVGESEIPHGTFHGMGIEDAVRRLLQIRKRTMGATEIYGALRQGGPHLQGETPSNTITSVLSRAFNSGNSDIVRVSRGLWGLQEWYPTRRFNRTPAAGRSDE